MKTEVLDIPDSILVRHELSACRVSSNDDGSFSMKIGHADLILVDLVECLNACREEIGSLKRDLFAVWQMLAHIADSVLGKPRYNDSCSLANLLFLSNAKQSHLVSLVFDELEETTKSLRQLFNHDISHMDPDLVEQFNETALEIRVLHVLLMREIYRSKVIVQCLKLEKVASVAGPWANLDLPYLERVWPYDQFSEHEEYMKSRERAKQQQQRYTPEYNLFGIYYNWQDLRRDPYRFSDRKTESPYPQRYISEIA